MCIIHENPSPLIGSAVQWKRRRHKPGEGGMDRQCETDLGWPLYPRGWIIAVRWHHCVVERLLVWLMYSVCLRACVHQDVWTRSGVQECFCIWIYVTAYMCALTYCMHVCACLNVSLHTQWFKSHLVPGPHIIAFCLPSPSHNPSFPECWLCCGSCISLHLFKYGLVCLTLPLCASSPPPLFPSVCLSWHFYCLAFETLFASFPFFCHRSKTTARRTEQNRREMHVRFKYKHLCKVFSWSLQLVGCRSDFPCNLLPGMPSSSLW